MADVLENKEHIAIVEKLATGYLIRAVDLGGWDGHDYYLERDEPHQRISGFDIERLIRLGFLESFNGGYRLSDAGKSAYLKSTDEMGDGKIRSPSTRTA